ncbi:serine hydrolase domain-containing protein [Enterococcus sp. AZ196]|uniref:serine hydrolase domain-containing protein n=1 Tax=Enterococcus sp. AZ196 TaxID=2774659 RepID=UPI003D2B4C03
MKKIMITMGILLLFLQLGMPVLAQEGQREVKTDETIERQIDQIMDKYIGKKIPGASIGIVQDGEIILTKGYGVSDIEKKTPVDGGKTVFEVGSITKLFTWSMLMKLAEEGKVKLDADIQEYLPKGTLNLTFDKKITILDLMSHTAGFEEKIEGMDLESVEQLKPLKETVTKENQPKQIYQPGTVTSYSNYGANLGGYIIEQVTGQSYTDYMNKFIHDQLKMDHSTFSMIYDDQLIIKDNLSLGYEPDASSIKKGKRFLGNDIPAGALLSTATDMSHFMLALLNDEKEAPFSLFKQSDTLEQLKAHSYSMVPYTPGNAHGFWEKEVANKRIIEHSENTSSFSSHLGLAPEERLGYVLLTNIGGEATGIRKELETLLYGESLPDDDLTPKKSVTDKKLVGRYRTARTMQSTMAKLSSIVFDSDIIITEDKKGGVNVKLPGETEYIQYVEVNSGIYQKVGNEQKTTIEQGGLNLKHLYFEFSDDEKVFRIGFGTVADFLPVTILNTQRFNLIAFVLSFVSFLATLIYLLIKFIRERHKKKGTNWSKNYMFLTIFSSIGLLVWISTFFMTLKFAMNPTMIISSMKWLFYINWLLPLSTIAMSGYLVANWYKYKGKKLTVFLLLISLLTIIIFYNLNLFF